MTHHAGGLDDLSGLRSLRPFWSFWSHSGLAGSRDTMGPRPVLKTRLSLAHQIVALQVGIVVLAAVAGTAAAVWRAHGELDTQYEQRSLAIAESVASMPDVQYALLNGDQGGTIQVTAEQVRKSTGALYVVVTDRNGIRYSHPNAALIGQRVDEEPGPVLAGHTWVGVQS